MKNAIYILLLVYAAIAAFTIVYFNGTGDPGDSINHYLFARYAPIHPQLYFDHWAKPVFVLLASPFAQFGFTGMKIFNAGITLLTIFITYRIALELDIQNSILTAVIMMFTPLYYILTFSGLTEPLFALTLAAAVYCAIKEKYLLSAIIISFLPYIRSEGLIFIGVFIFYFLLKKNLRPIPWLLLGSFVYAVAGFFAHHNLLWVFTEIPYASTDSYGSGELSEFVVGLLYVVGVPIYGLLWLGFISMIRLAIFKKFIPEEHILIVTGFAAFVFAHSLFWFLGIFHSMGLKRVMLSVMPLMALIAVHGFNFLTLRIIKHDKKLRLALQVVIIAYIVIFPFTSNPAAVQWHRDMSLFPEQVLAKQITDAIQKDKAKNVRILASHPYVFELMKKDCFDTAQALHLSGNNLSRLHQGDIIVWDNWFSVIESGIYKETLDKNPSLISLYNASGNARGRHIEFVAYEVR
jgi:hypothetical protein